MWLDSRLALWLEAPRILVVADLHWGYAASHRAQGNLLPAWGDGEIAGRLTALLQDYQPAEMIWLGDSLHTLAGAQSAEQFLSETAVSTIIVSGNHDARWARARNLAEVQRGPYLFHHGDRARAVPEGSSEIIGHFHPAASWHDGAGTRLKLPALVASSGRMVLPAFSPWAAGVPWLSTVPGETVYAISSKRIFTLAYPRSHKEA
ncbi:MAG: metallophosphoesterase [Opitutus sp.]